MKIKFFQKKVILIIILSAVVFGICHGYSSIYIVYGFLGGLVFAYSYYVYINKDYSSFWVVTSIHSIRNLIVFIYSIILMN
ncbi:Abortive infection protein (fragment) [Acetoanaerobium sticklandii]|uniref:Abortive infection protein n=1 Tax=Acetoanaerobium sticklandii (strain ATCC 12662 / DSM 519 / JCM 1433 / CCUG 9281 / NCIMB 10654 / HF) TaxID=499177 RepID=E3PUW5_ACESD